MTVRRALQYLRDSGIFPEMFVYARSRPARRISLSILQKTPGKLQKKPGVEVLVKFHEERKPSGSVREVLMPWRHLTSSSMAAMMMQVQQTVSIMRKNEEDSMKKNWLLEKNRRLVFIVVVVIVIWK
ncbi:hypothetical protein LOK49_LG11G01368 [Camellia lanceoleosa]|uniref:Uncharacterized protein n=1 Tax=Camellia lanceoleosa TaxID=1840588 RepID=A0ACC0G235_9ERIC|nr:hypothetical protein LOK49_LG11G01368 [Camellia lanceoleosa]